MDDKARSTRRRRRMRSLLNRFGWPLAVIGGCVLLISLPITLPLALFLAAREKKRMQALADVFACGCGKILGREALSLADACWERHARASLSEAPDEIGSIPHLRRRLDAICTHCGRQYEYIDKARIFAPTPWPIPLAPPIGEPGPPAP
jgi:hypothetical protein